MGPFGATRVLLGLAQSRLFGSFSLADLTLYLAAFTLVLTCFSWGSFSLVVAVLLATALITGQKSNTVLRDF